MARRGTLSGQPPRERAEEVYAAALRLFRQKGYHATSMQDIADAVGLYKGSLYHYIGSKEDLLVHVFERGLGDLLDQVEVIAGDPRLGPTAQLREIVCAHVVAVTRNMDALTVYLHEVRALSGVALETVRRQHDRYTELLSSVVRRGVASGEFQATDGAVGPVTQGLLGMCNWVCQWYRPDGRLAPAQIGELFAEMVLGGLAATSSLRPERARPGSRQTSESRTTSSSS